MSDSHFKCFIETLSAQIEFLKNDKSDKRYPFEKEANICYYTRVLQLAESIYKIPEVPTNMSVKIEQLEKENEQLKKQLAKNTLEKIKTAHEIINEIIAEKVNSSVKSDLSSRTRCTLRREIMEGLKWHLQVRYVRELKDEHIVASKEFIKNYKINDFYLATTNNEK